MKLRSLHHLHRPSLSGIAAAALGVVLLGLAATANAQTLGKATIDFPFIAGNAQCAAGAYDIDASAGKITLTAKDSKQSAVVMLVITRLGRHDQDNTTELVFDKVNGQLKLSEVWLGAADGYLVASTPGDHEHRVLGGSKPHK
jgi:hypothetical protein